MEKLFLIIPVFNRYTYIFSLLDNLLSQEFKEFSVIIVDHGTIKINFSCYEAKRITVIKASSSLWWTGAVNIGVNYVLSNKVSDETFILILNDDVVLDKDYLCKMYEAGQHNPESMICSSCLNIQTNKLMYAGFHLNKIKARFEPLFKDWLPEQIQADLVKSDILVGRGLLIPIHILKKIGLFNEVLLPHYGADSEFSWRASQRGVSLYFSKNAILKTKLKDEKIYEFQQNLLKFISNIKKPGNMPAVFNFALICFNRYYAIYYITINFIRHYLSYLKRLLCKFFRKLPLR